MGSGESPGNLANDIGEGKCVDEQEEKEEFSSSTCSKARKGEFHSSFDRESEDLTMCSQGSSS